MKRLAGLMTLVLALSFWGYIDAQQVTQRAKLEELSQLFGEQLQARRTQLYYDLLKSDALPQRWLNEDTDIQLMYIDERGHPVYYMVENLNAARTISTDDVWPGGSGGFSLSSSGTGLGELAIWDGGGVLTTHQEFSGRVTQMDSPGGTHYHSTHVAGTMIAAGVDANAKGMSFQGTLAAYDWNNDNSEMASAAAAGMNTSNHSYGYVTGWYYSGDWYWWGDITISTTEDYGFGFYGSTAQEWDSIAYYAPYYTIVKSAGNDRNDYGPGPGGEHWVWDPDSADWVWSTDTRDQDGGTDGYDCIPWFANAKNIITVGAVEDIPGGYTSPSDVVMSSFSGWGPADDGRIKPDLVANGISLYSCTDASNSSYNSYSGTSMSSPNLSGSLNLLIRHYEATHADTTPLSSTMKGVLIQTADEAGPNTGPDYMFGWGLMSTLKAAQVIHQDSAQQGLIIEESLDDGDTDEYYLYSDGSDPIRITLAWTDPPGTPPPASLNPTTPMLVNDLDLRLEHAATSNTYLPYVLDPDSPDSPASADDNVTDNAEQIYIASPPAGDYIVTVLHKGTLSSAQYYSLVSSSELTVAPPPVILSTSPTQNELSVPINTNISVTFSVDMDETTINDSTFVVNAWSTGIHQGTITYNSGTKTATLNPSEDFAVGEIVTVVLTTDIQSSVGLPLDSSYAWSFTTDVSEESPGTFARAVNYWPGDYPHSVFCADLDADGNLDLAAANDYSQNVSILINDGDGVFPTIHSFAIGTGAGHAFCADFDADLDIDVAVTAHYANTIYILENDGHGTFQVDSGYIVGGYPDNVFCADIDNDGDLDLALTNFSTDDLSVLKNDGYGTFNLDSNYAVGDEPEQVFCADLDGDGDWDLAVANRQSNNVSVLMNNGDGTFQDSVNYGAGAGTYSVFCADLDGDGDLDLATADYDAGTVSILQNMGDGTFDLDSNYTVGTWPHTVFCADLDGDGDLDLAVANANSANVSILKNNGDGTFQDAINYEVLIRPERLFCADVDGDGDLDLAVPSAISDSVSILLNCVDIDQDLICDESDNCPAVYNPDQEDLDYDAAGDSCDNCVAYYNPDQEDTDEDGVGDSCDICPFVYNPDQEDADGDGHGDSCDNCLADYNPDQEDADGDSYGDSCDICPYHAMDDCCNPVGSNIAPEVTSDAEDTAMPSPDPYVYFATASDENCDGTELEITFFDIPSWCDTSGDTLFGLVPCDAVDTSFKVTVSDGDLSDTLEVSLFIDHSNVAPTIESPGDTLVVCAGDSFAYYPAITDPDDSVHLISYLEYPHWCSIQNDSVVGIAPDSIFLEALTVRAQDYCNVDTLSFTVQTSLSGDANADGAIDLGDVLYLISYLYKGGPAPDPLEAGDADCNGGIDLGDVLYLIGYLYKGGPAPDCCEP